MKEYTLISELASAIQKNGKIRRNESKLTLKIQLKNAATKKYILRVGG